MQQTILMVGDITDTYVTSFQKMMRDDNFTVEELGAIAFGYTKLLEESNDASIAAWAREDVADCSALGLLNGSDGAFRPEEYQLMISGGDVKAVQGTTGHATADMLVNTYAHIQQSSRVELGRKFEEGFYAKQESPSPQAVPAEGEPTISMTALLELLKNADPEVKAQLRLALLT